MKKLEELSSFCYLANEFNVISFDVLDNHDLHLGQEVQCQFIDGISKNALLNKENITAAGLDLLDNIEDIGTLLLENTIHLGVVTDNDIVFHLHLHRFWVVRCRTESKQSWPSLLFLVLHNLKSSGPRQGHQLTQYRQQFLYITATKKSLNLYFSKFKIL